MFIRKYCLAVSLFFLLMSVFSLPAAAGDCTVIECNCVGIIYKDKNLSAPNDLSTRKFSWENAGRRINRNVGKLKPVLVLVFYNQFNISGGPNQFDNLNTSDPWSALAVSFVPANGSLREQLNIHLYDTTPAYGQIDNFVSGDAGNDTTGAIGQPLGTGLDFAILTGVDSGPLDLATADALIQRAIDNRKDALVSDVLTNGC